MKTITRALCTAVLLSASGCGGTTAVVPTEAPQHPAAHMHSMAAMAGAPSSPAAMDDSAGVAGAAGTAALEAPSASVAVATAPTPVAVAATATITGTITAKPASAAKHAVVYLENAPLARVVDGAMDNRQMAFLPYVVVVTAGAKVTFRNSDPFPHNVFSPDNERWDMGIIASGGARVKKFEKAGVYTALCNMHPNMKAFVVVTPSSYFSKSNAKGAYSITDVPVGTYQLVTWAPGVKLHRQELVVDGDKSLDIALQR